MTDKQIKTLELRIEIEFEWESVSSNIISCLIECHLLVLYLSTLWSNFDMSVPVELKKYGKFEYVLIR